MKKSLRYGFELVNTTETEIAEIMYGAFRVSNGADRIYKAKLFTGKCEGEIVFPKSTHNHIIAYFELVKQGKTLYSETTSISMNNDVDDIFASVIELITQYHNVKDIETRIRCCCLKRKEKVW